LEGSPLPYIFGEPQRGDSVMLYPVEENGPYLVKRIVGLTNELVSFEEGQLYINGRRVDEPYLSAPCYSCGTRAWVSVEIEYFVLGDNRNVSRDSCNYGAISRDQIIARVLFRRFSLNELSTFGN